MLLIEEGKDYEDVDETELPYTLLKNLGHGHSGIVEKVRDEMTKAVFARKIIYTTHSRLRKQERIQVFHNEVKIIRVLGSHRHIVSVFATYVTKRHFGLILQPVASDGDLEDFLGEYWSLFGDMEDKSVRNVRVERMVSVMERAFGCLTAGLAFMHKKKVRHKDIKPRNILVHNGMVLYTDFGYSFDSNAFSRSTTEVRPAFLTRKYSAPEVLEYEKRNSKSDVFSLGCVFIDLLFALTMIPGAEHEVKNYSESIDDILNLLKSFRISSRYSSLPNIIREMTMRDNSLRLCSFHVANRVLALPDFSCPDCQLTPIVAWGVGYNREFFVAENDLNQNEEIGAPKKCCIESAQRELVRGHNQRSREPKYHEAFASNKRRRRDVITRNFPPSFTPTLEISELRYCIPFTIDKKGLGRDNQGRLQGYLGGGVDSLNRLGYKIRPDCGIYDISGHLIGRYQLDKIEHSADEEARICPTSKENEVENMKTAIQVLSPKHKLHPKSLESSGSRVNPPSQQAPATQSVDISPPDRLSRHWVYNQAASSPPSPIPYPPLLALHRYEGQSNTLPGQAPQFNRILSFEGMRNFEHRQVHDVLIPSPLPIPPLKPIGFTPGDTSSEPPSPKNNLNSTHPEIFERIALDHNIKLPKLPFPRSTDWATMGPLNLRE